MGTRAVSHIWFCWAMNVDCVTPVSTFFQFAPCQLETSQTNKLAGKVGRIYYYYYYHLLFSLRRGEALHEESFNFQFTRFSHFRERRKIFLGAHVFSCLCNCIYSLNTYSSLGLYFFPLLLPCSTDVFCLSPIFPTQREDKDEREGKTGSMKMPFSFALLSLFLFSCCCSIYIYHTYWMPRWGRPGFATILTVSAYFWQYFFERILFSLLLSTGRHAGSICRIPSGMSKRPVKWEFRRATLYRP